MGDVGAFAKLGHYFLALLGEPRLASWRARKLVEAEKILAHGEADAMKIRAIGAANAELAAREMLAKAGIPQSLLEEIEGEIDQRIDTLFENRLSNLVQIVTKAERALPPGQVPDVEPDLAWTSSFSEAAQDVSDEEMQEMWARVLAGEVARAGTTSLRTMNVLCNLDQRPAQLFKRLCSLSVSLWEGDLTCLDHRLVSFNEDTHRNSPTNFGIRFGDLLVLNEYQLIANEFSTRVDYRAAVCGPGNLEPGRELHGRLRFQGQEWALIHNGERDFNQEFWVPGVSLTQAGRELSKVVEVERISGYAESLSAHFARQGLDMVRVPSND